MQVAGVQGMLPSSGLAQDVSPEPLLLFCLAQLPGKEQGTASGS